MGVGYNPKIVINGLVGYWDVGNLKSYPGSGTTWTDLSGKNNHAAFSVGTPTFTSDRVTFDGNTYAVTPNYTWITNSTDPNSMFAWIYPTTSPSGIIISYGEYNDREYANGLFISPTGYVGFAKNGSITDIYAASSSFAVELNKWAYIGYVRSGTTSVTIFYNNNYATISDSGGNGTVITSNPFTIGSGSTNTDKGQSKLINTSISNIKVYNRALSAAEISQNYNALRGRYGI